MHATLHLIKHGPTGSAVLEVRCWQHGIDVGSSVTFSASDELFVPLNHISAAINAAFPEPEAKS